MAAQLFDGLKAWAHEAIQVQDWSHYPAWKAAVMRQAYVLAPAHYGGRDVEVIAIELARETYNNRKQIIATQQVEPEAEPDTDPEPEGAELGVSMRREGHTWATIAKQLGVSPPTARKRVISAFGGDPKQR